jgi:DNA processing protein
MIDGGASAGRASGSPACDRCVARSWLLTRLGGHLEQVRGRALALLTLEDLDLIDAVAGRDREPVLGELDQLDLRSLRSREAAAGVESICRHDPAYPPPLLTLANPPAAIYVAGGVERLLRLLGEAPVALVGSRRASAYGIEVAQALGGGLAGAGITVLSGMAFGIDSAAHAGALASCGPTVAVLPGPVDRPYPAGKRALHRRIVATGAAISELPPGARIWRWAFPARNRIIAALSAMTVVIEAGERSGALLTADVAGSLGRIVGAVPGRVTSPGASGPNELLAAGAVLVRDTQDVLDAVYGAGVRRVGDRRPELDHRLAAILSVLGDGDGTLAALERAGFAAAEALAAVASLELSGHVRRGPGGRFATLP